MRRAAATHGRAGYRARAVAPMSKSAYPFRPSAQATDDDTSDQNPGQHWDQLLGGSVPRGLSGLGLATRVAVYQLSCDRGVSWLQRHLNPDGSIGSDPDDWIFVRTHHHLPTASRALG